MAARLAGTSELSDLSKIPLLISVGETGAPVLQNISMAEKANRFVIEIPDNIGAVERENAGLARDWRMATRNAFSRAIGNGFIVEDFNRQNRLGRQIGAYVLGSNKNIVS